MGNVSFSSAYAATDSIDLAGGVDKEFVVIEQLRYRKKPTLHIHNTAVLWQLSPEYATEFKIT